MEHHKRKIRGITLLRARPAFGISLLVIPVIVLGVWLLGAEWHRTLYANALLSLSVLAFLFFIFISGGLFYGVKLKDDLGRITDRARWRKMPGSKLFARLGEALGTAAEDILWIAFWVALGAVLWLLGNVFWIAILVFTAMLYRVFFRALRLVFKKGPVCKGNLLKSVTFGLAYTMLYSCWIYAIIFVTHRLVP